MDSYIAHVREDGAEQSVLSHLEGTRELAVEFAGAFGAEGDASMAALLHDIGKYSAQFQEHIRHPERNLHVDHSTAGAQAAGRDISPVAFAVAGHHGGLPDGGSRADTADAGTLYGRIGRKVEDCAAWRTEQTPPTGGGPAFLRGADRLAYAFYTRMLYSCLVDADYLDTERFMQGDRERGKYDPLPLLESRFAAYLKSWSKPPSPLNGERDRILSRCLEAGDRVPGLYTLTVPTGGGKTVSSLGFALRHVVRWGMKRIVYVIPYTSIIDQTAQTFRKILGEENVLEHHSGVDFTDHETMTPAEYRRILATENWDAPVIVTTAVQFFESLYANRSSKCRKLHNLAGAVLIFDEAQTLPVPYLTPCVEAVAQLVKHYGATAVLCTATQPALEPLFADRGVAAQEICPDAGRLHTVFRRTTIRNLGQTEPEELLARLGELPRALCVVNSRKAAQDLYRGLEGEGTFCLSTLLYPLHRKRLLEEIRGRLARGEPCRVISTSLIEAGVDLDFPAVLREMAGLDSIIQAAGRCNRQGGCPAEDAAVYVFRTGAAPPPMLRVNISAAESVMRDYADPASPEAIRAYFAFYRTLKGSAELDRKGILDAFTRGIQGCCFPFAQVAERFNLMEAPTRTVYIPQGEGEALTQRLLDGEISRGLLRAAGQYGVNVYHPHFRALDRAGALALLPSGDAVLTEDALYQSNTGLQLDVPFGQGLTM